MSRATSWAAAVAAGLVVCGCGGSGGSGGGGDSPPPAMPVDCGPWPDSLRLADDLPDSVITDVVVVDACSVIISGHYDAQTPLAPTGDADGFVLRLRLRAGGQVTEEWRYYLATAATDSVQSLEATSQGLRLIGRTGGTLPGEIHYGQSDVVIGELGLDGTLLGLTQIGDERPNRPLQLFPLAAGGFLLVGNDDVYVPTNYVEAWEEPWIAGIGVEADRFRVQWWLRTGLPVGDFYHAATFEPASETVVLARLTTSGDTSGLTVEQRDRYGVTLWTTPLTRSPGDTVAGFLRSPSGELLVFGSSYQTLAGSGAGSADLFLAALDPADGALRRISQFGSPATDWASAVVAHAGRIYAVSEMSVEESPQWRVHVTTLGDDGDVLGDMILLEDGAAQSAAVVGTQLVVVGAVAGATGDLRGWLGFAPL